MPTRTVKTLAAAWTVGLGLVAATHAEPPSPPGVVRISDQTSDAPAIIEDVDDATPLAPDAVRGEGEIVVEGAPHGVAAPGHGEYYVEEGDHVPGHGYPPHVGPDVRIYRTPVAYRYWHHHPPYGAPGHQVVSTAPMVYMPTDTTQLGFYYQQVPHWVPRPNALPRPWFAPAPRDERHGGHHWGHPHGEVHHHPPQESYPPGWTPTPIPADES